MLHTNRRPNNTAAGCVGEFVQCGLVCVCGEAYNSIYSVHCTHRHRTILPHSPVFAVAGLNERACVCARERANCFFTHTRVTCARLLCRC